VAVTEKGEKGKSFSLSTFHFHFHFPTLATT
jgi:hypothetical protein